MAHYAFIRFSDDPPTLIHTNGTERHIAILVNRLHTSVVNHRPVFARFMPVLLNGDKLGLNWGLSSRRVPFRMANSLSCCFL